MTLTREMTLSWCLTVNYDSTRPGNPDFQCLGGSCVYRIMFVPYLMPSHASSEWAHLWWPSFFSSGLPSSCPYAFHTSWSPNVFQTFVDFTANKKYPVIRNITHANIGTCLRYVPIHRSEHKYVLGKHKSYRLYSNVISYLSAKSTTH